MNAGNLNVDSFGDQIEILCDRFEREWQAGARPRIQEYVAEAPEPARHELAGELLKLDIHYRRERGDSILAGDYAEFPEHASLVGTLLRLSPKAASSRVPASKAGKAGGNADGRPLPDTLSEELGASTVFSAPRLFGDYEIIKELGKGGMGIVYLVRQRSAGNREVALKVIRLDRLEHLRPEQRQEWLDRFRTEGQAAARLRHDNIVTVYEVGTVDGTPFYSMAYIEGESLDPKLRDGPLPNALAATYIEQVARAVHYAHENHILHRDLKPQNIMTDAKGRAYVTDFGLAKWTESAEGPTHTGQMLGSPPYMSPEQATEAAGVTEATDVYSLGATLYALVTGRPPFQAAGVVETLDQVRHQEPVAPRLLNPAVDRNLDTIILACLRKEPGRRYSGALALADDLRAYCDGKPIKARPIRAWERAWMWSRRNRAVAVSLGAFLMAMTAGTAFSTYFGIDSAQQTVKAKSNEAAAVVAKNHMETLNEELTQSQDDLERTLARSLVRPLGVHLLHMHRGSDSRDDKRMLPLTDPEIEALWDLSMNRAERLGYRFVEEALRQPMTIRQLRVRAEPAVHAAVGLDPAKRAQVEKLLLKRLQDPDLDDNLRSDVAVIAAALADLTPPAAARMTDALAQSMANTKPTAKPMSPGRPMLRHYEHLFVLTELAQALAATATMMEPTDAVATLKRLLAHPKLQSSDMQYWLAKRLVAEATRMDPRRGAAILAEFISKTTSEYLLAESAQALASLAARLEPKDCARFCALAAASLTAAMGKATEKGGYPALAEGVAALASRMEPNEASQSCTRAADLLTKTIGNIGPDTHLDAKALGALAPYLESRESARLFDHAVGFLTLHANNTFSNDLLPQLMQSTLALANRLEPKEAEEVAATLSKSIAKGGPADWCMARALAAVTVRMEPEQGAAILRQALTESTSGAVLHELADKLPAVAERLGQNEAKTLLAQAAGILSKARLASALARVTARMEPEERSLLCANAIESLTSAMVSASGNNVREWPSEEVSALAARLEPGDAMRTAATLNKMMAEHWRSAAIVARNLAIVAARMEPKEGAAMLGKAMTKMTSERAALRELALGMAALDAHLDHKEGAGFCAQAANIIVKDILAMTISDNNSQDALCSMATDVAALAAHMEPETAHSVCVQAALPVSQLIAKSAQVVVIAQSARALALLAARMNRAEATKVCGEAIVSISQKVSIMEEWQDVDSCCFAIAILADQMESSQAGPIYSQVAGTLFQAMSTEAYQHTARDVAESLQWLLTGSELYRASQRAAKATATVSFLADTSPAGATIAALVLTQDLCRGRFTTADLVELLKQPTCTGLARREILDQLEIRYGRKFSDHWAFVRFAEERNLGFNFSSPPKRLTLTYTAERP
jgi:predicted Ser/Thr protein kinase